MSNDENDGFYEKLKKYQSKLLQLGKSNRCVCLSRIYNKHNFDLSRLLENHSKKIDKLIQQSFKRKRPVCVLPDSDFSEEADIMRRHLKDLARNIKQLEDETGSRYCYFGFPFLEGHLDQEHYLRGPLVLFPIAIYYGQEESREVGWHVKFSDSIPIFNHTLFVALEKIGGYKMSDTFESDFEDAVSSFEIGACTEPEKEFMEKILTLLNSNGLNVSDSENKGDVSTLRNISRDAIESMERQPIRIKNYKIIGSFPQGESAIYHDYEKLISKIADGNKNDFIADILGETNSPAEFAEDIDDEDLDKVRDMELNLILPSDSSQDQIVLASQNQKITLVRGPPGTGKSQVIVNIISNALSKGQTVLVVCQKRAALEVVHQRLGEKNLDRYAVLLNKEKEDRAKMYSQLKQILETPNGVRHEQEQMLQTTSKQIDDLIKRHSEISYALSKEYFGGVTARDLYTKSSSDHSTKLELSGIGDEITYPKLEDFLFNLSQIEEDYKIFEDDNYSWKNRRNFAERNSSDKAKINDILSEILSKSENCVILSDKQSQDKLIELSLRYYELNEIINSLQANIEKSTKSIQGISVKHNVPIPLGSLKEQIRRVDAGMVLWNRFGGINQINHIRNNHIQEETKEKQNELLGTFADTGEKRSFWKKLIDSETKRKDRLQKEFLKRPENSGKTLSELRTMLEDGLELWNLVTNHSQTEYIFKKPFVLPNDSDQDHLLCDLKSLSDDKTRLKNHSDELQEMTESLREIFERHELFFDKDEDASQLISKATNGRDILDNINSFSEFVSDEEVQTIKNKSADTGELLSHIKNLHDHLGDFDRLLSHDIRKTDLTLAQQAILDQCVSRIGLEQDWTDIVRQEIYHYWIEAIEQDHRILKAGYFDDYKDSQARLSSLMEKKSQLLVNKIVSSIESNADFRPGMGIKRTQRETSAAPIAFPCGPAPGMGIKRTQRETLTGLRMGLGASAPRMGIKRTQRETEYNELNYELGKKRRVKPVRKLLEQYEHILFDIAPCWLASPEMISNIFPLEQNMFDLVVVDEASQLAAERALPFLYRGERIVIAGDEKQLKPHDLFQIKEEDTDEEIDDTLDIESLLLLAERRYTPTTLKWHYRSKWQELIDFSNHAFYNGVLQVSPNVQLKAPQQPIRWVECPEGLWENRSNIAESVKVVDVLYDILQDHKDQKPPTIGIITFNDQQRNIIMDEIENRQKKDPLFDELYKRVETLASGKKDDEIFVRNIENVQGDERDIVIFSVGYAKDPEGKFRLQFGTLNQDGGENRLNVAVTRASQKIIVVCSIDPQDMKVEGTKNPGPKRLRDFLVYAKAVNDGDNERVEQVLGSLSSAMHGTRSQTKRFDSKFEELVHDRLENLGYTVETQVGQSGYRIDLAIVDPNDPSRYILGVECDGAMFHSGKSVRERDVMRQKFLERRGWNIDRIWSRNWWRNPNREVQRIKEKIDSLVENQSSRASLEN